MNVTKELIDDVIVCDLMDDEYRTTGNNHP